MVDKFAFRDANDKANAMFRVSDPGDTTLALDALVHKDEVREANALAEAERIGLVNRVVPDDELMVKWSRITVGFDIAR